LPNLAADRVYELLDTDPQVSDPEHPLPLAPGLRQIMFDDVLFQYSAANPVLRRINFTVDPGESIAIVGLNGCGKLTLINHRQARYQA
jgi:ATP-binding cassette subfamily B protein